MLCHSMRRNPIETRINGPKRTRAGDQSQTKCPVGGRNLWIHGRPGPRSASLLRAWLRASAASCFVLPRSVWAALDGRARVGGRGRFVAPGHAPIHPQAAGDQRAGDRHKPGDRADQIGVAGQEILDRLPEHAAQSVGQGDRRAKTYACGRAKPNQMARPVPALPPRFSGAPPPYCTQPVPWFLPAPRIPA